MQAVKKVLRPFKRAALAFIREEIPVANDQPKDFDHGRAQHYEARHNLNSIQESFVTLYEARNADRLNDGVWIDTEEWFDNDQKKLDDFVAHTKDKECLEIGSGPFGVVPLCDWMTKRTVIDPLADVYKQAQLDLSGETFFKEMTLLSIPAEQFEPGLKNKIDGAIICRNAIDHAEDPLKILNNIAQYAAPGCYLLFWSDIWHENLDDGHRNITRSVELMDRLVDGLGFDVQWQHPLIRDQSEYIEYGCVARKR